MWSRKKAWSNELEKTIFFVTVVLMLATGLFQSDISVDALPLSGNPAKKEVEKQDVNKGVVIWLWDTYQNMFQIKQVQVHCCFKINSGLFLVTEKQYAKRLFQNLHPKQGQLNLYNHHPSLYIINHFVKYLWLLKYELKNNTAWDKS